MRREIRISRCGKAAIAATFRVLLVDIHHPGGAAVLNLAVVGAIMLVAAFSERASFARLLDAKSRA
jgi:hypothetical protein